VVAHGRSAAASTVLCIPIAASSTPRSVRKPGAARRSRINRAAHITRLTFSLSFVSACSSGEPRGSPESVKAIRDACYLAWIRTLPCLCGAARGIEASHTGPRDLSQGWSMREPKDRWCVNVSRMRLAMKWTATIVPSIAVWGRGADAGKALHSTPKLSHPAANGQKTSR
jgi:hypothetical protein